MSSKEEPRITILTDPIPNGIYYLPEFFRKLNRTVRNVLRSRAGYTDCRRYRGHHAVTRSLIEGFQKSGISFVYNPGSVRDCSDTVVVLAGERTLRQAIALKKTGKIRKLFAGPNIVTFSSDADSILASPEIDVVIAPSKWVIDMYLEDNPSLEGRCFSWPAGVNTDFWKPNPSTRRKQILIFEKQGPGSVGPVEPYADYLRQNGYEVSIFKYGTYTHAQYLEELQRSQLMIGFVASESQGIAWAEAWAVGVPTFIWKNNLNIHRGRSFRCSTAPYLLPENGMHFDDLNDFKVKFALWEESQELFDTRAWTLANMSDEVCASILHQRITSC